MKSTDPKDRKIRGVLGRHKTVVVPGVDLGPDASFSRPLEAFEAHAKAASRAANIISAKQNIETPRENTDDEDRVAAVERARLLEDGSDDSELLLNIEDQSARDLTDLEIRQLVDHELSNFSTNMNLLSSQLRQHADESSRIEESEESQVIEQAKRNSRGPTDFPKIGQTLASRSTKHSEAKQQSGLRELEDLERQLAAVSVDGFSDVVEFDATPRTTTAVKSRTITSDLNTGSLSPAEFNLDLPESEAANAELLFDPTPREVGSR